MATSSKNLELAQKARSIYDQRLKSGLEVNSRDQFVAIEPESGDYFLAPTLSEAIQAARSAYPDRYPFALRVGHSTTVEMGTIRL